MRSEDFRAQGLGLRVEGLALRVEGLGPKRSKPTSDRMRSGASTAQPVSAPFLPPSYGSTGVSVVDREI